MERAHRSLKSYVHKIKKGEYTTPRDQLSYVLYILNCLNVDAHLQAAADRHWRPTSTGFPMVK